MKNYLKILLAFAVTALLCFLFVNAPAQDIIKLSPETKAELKGEKGEQGIQGIQGEKGEKGDKGDAGTGSGSVNYGFIRYVATFNEYYKAFRDADAGLIHKIILTSDFAFTDSVPIPTNMKGQLYIEGNGASLTDAVGLSKMHFRYIASLTEANKRIDFQLIVTGVEFKGKNRSGNCFELSSNYQSHFQHCRFKGFKIAVDNRFCLQGSIRDCQFDNNTISINVDFDRFPNNTGGNTSAQSNHYTIADNKFRSTKGDSCNIRCNAASGVMIWHNIHEGGDNNGIGAKYAVVWLDNGSTVVKECNFLYEHIEFIPEIAIYNIVLKDGMATVSGQFIQKTGTVVIFTTTAYAKIKVKDIPFLNNGAKFQSVGSGARWTFENMHPSFDAYNATNWIGAVPVQTVQIGYSTNGQAPYYKINNKQVTTTP